MTPKLLPIAGLLVLTAACSAASEEAVGASDQDLIRDIQSMQQRTDGMFDVICKNGSREVVTAEQIDSQQVCGGGIGGGRVAIFSDNRCSPGSVAASLAANTDCDSLGGYSWSAESVMVNGRCIDIAQTYLANACKVYKPGSTPIFGDNSCTPNSVAASITTTTNCDSLGGYSWSAESVMVNGECIDIAQTYLANACKVYRPGSTPIFGDNSCTPNSVAATIDASTNCDSLGGYSWSAESILVNGRCIDIAQTYLANACKTYKPGTVAIFGDNRCTPNSVAASIDSSTDCSTLGGYSWSAESVLVNGECIDIPQTYLSNACQVYHP